MQRGTLMIRVVVLAVVASFWASVSSAQNVSLVGRIADPRGGAVNGARVTVTADVPASPRTTRSGADGTFTVDAVPAGSVTVQVEADGFEPSRQTLTLTAVSDPITIVLK